MPLTIGSNISSLRVQSSLARNSADLAGTFERLSSGLRINRASDDAAGLAVSSLLGADRRVYSQGIRNLNDGLSFLSVAEGAIGQLSNIVIRQRELAEQAANGTFTGSQRVALNNEAQSLAAEYQRILETTGFNGMNLLDGSTTSVSMQAGYGSTGNINATLLETSSQEITEGTGTYTFLNANFGKSPGVPLQDTQLLVADLNLDGVDDIIAMRDYDNQDDKTYDVDVAIFLGAPDGDFKNSPALQYTIATAYGGAGFSSGTFSADIQDIGGDGDFDIGITMFVDTTLFSIEKESGLENLLGDDGLDFKEVAAGAKEDQLASNVEGDFNNDGVLDGAEKDGFDLVFLLQDTTTTIETLPELLSQDDFTLLTRSGALSALTQLEENLTKLSDATARIGASQSRLSTAVGVLGIAAENFAAAESQIKDADFAFESAQLVRQQLLQQASAAILAQANQQPALALSLLQNI